MICNNHFFVFSDERRIGLKTQLIWTLVNRRIQPANFIKRGIRVGERRHLLFAIDDALKLLGSEKVWYIDGTFQLAREPFKQLLTIHAFIRSEG